MRKMMLFFMMMSAVVLLISGCQAEEADATCSASLADIMADSPFMSITGVELTEAAEVPVPGGETDQMIALNEETLVLSRYPSSEEAAAQLAPDALQKVFSDLGTIVEDSPLVFGDETSWVELNEGPSPELAIVRYGDRLAIAESVMEASMQEILGGFDTALLAYIGEHPECAYLHPETR